MFSFMCLEIYILCFLKDTWTHMQQFIKLFFGSNLVRHHFCPCEWCANEDWQVMGLDVVKPQHTTSQNRMSISIRSQKNLSFTLMVISLTPQHLYPSYSTSMDELLTCQIVNQRWQNNLLIGVPKSRSSPDREELSF